MASNATVELVTRQLDGVDSDGNDRYTQVVTEVAGVFAPVAAYENTTAGDQTVTQPVVYLPDLGITAFDAVRVNGVTYEVDGEPDVWPTHPFTGWRPDLPVVVALRKVTG